MPIWGRSRDARISRITAAMTAGLLLTGCATAAPKTLANLTADETQTIDQTCQQTIPSAIGLIGTIAGALGALALWRIALIIGANFLFERPAAFWIAPQKASPAIQAAE